MSFIPTPSPSVLEKATEIASIEILIPGSLLLLLLSLAVLLLATIDRIITKDTKIAIRIFLYILLQVKR